MPAQKRRFPTERWGIFFCKIILINKFNLVPLLQIIFVGKAGYDFQDIFCVSIGSESLENFLWQGVFLDINYSPVLSDPNHVYGEVHILHPKKVFAGVVENEEHSLVFF